jgi:hypothetical protein
LKLVILCLNLEWTLNRYIYKFNNIIEHKKRWSSGRALGDPEFKSPEAHLYFQKVFSTCAGICYGSVRVCKVYWVNELKTHPQRHMAYRWVSYRRPYMWVKLNIIIEYATWHIGYAPASYRISIQYACGSINEVMQSLV